MVYPHKAGWQANLPWTYLVTDRRLGCGRSLFSIVEAALKGGANVVQYREKSAGTRVLITEAAALKALCAKYGALFIVNDRVDVALAVGAPGVHLGQDDMPVTLARKLLGPEVIIGVSASSVVEAVAGAAAGADYIGASAVFATPTKTEAPALGLAGLTAICGAVSLPVVAIGGLNAGNAGGVLAAGAQGVAVVSAIMAAGNPEKAARELAALVGAGRR
ncbi:MAG: thiamine phosphate synthase [Heliobacteriaceae bacterium]|nr:thiamine phosphate synthase [Heliobacteriaceae bacterium]